MPVFLFILENAYLPVTLLQPKLNFISQRLIMIEYYNSGYINFRGRKIGIVWSGETAQHVMEEHLKDAKTHPLTHLRIQQLAKRVKEWEKAGDKRHTGLITDTQSGHRFLIIADIYTKFAIMVTAYKN